MGTIDIIDATSLSTAQRTLIEEAIADRALELGRESLTEQGRRALRSDPEAVHVLELDGDRLEGYALCTSGERTLVVELLGDEGSTALVDACAHVATARGVPLSLWIHGLTDGSSPHALPPSLRSVRSILRLSRPLPAPPPPMAPQGISIRSFRPGDDDEMWLALNARSFHEHPEQGRWGRAELEQRMAEAWFSPEGFLLAMDDSLAVGFCWTKLHQDPWGTSGEIYIIGVDPDAAGRGIGRLLTLSGLSWLSQHGAPRGTLYVEQRNNAAVSLYRSLGFHTDWVDVLFESTD